jgi:hypothetical protein
MKKFDEFITENRSEESIAEYLKKIAHIIRADFYGEPGKLFQFDYEIRNDGLISFQLFLYDEPFLGGRVEIEKIIEDEDIKMKKLLKFQSYKSIFNMSEVYASQSIVSGNDGYHKQFLVKFNWTGENDLFKEEVMNYVNSHGTIKKYNL